MDLSWNSIRGRGGVALAKSLRVFIIVDTYTARYNTSINS